MVDLDTEQLGSIGEHEVAAFVALGASVHSRHEGHDGEHGWVVLRDPEGNEFCAVLLT